MITLNGERLNVTRFPDKTSQVWQLDNPKSMNFAYVVWRFEDEAEFMHIAQLKDLLDKYGIESYLRLDYLPYGRQDKEVSNESTFALRSFAKLLNTLKFKEVIVVDPHSDIAFDVLKNMSAVYLVNSVEHAIGMTGTNLLVYPDKGALKYKKIYSELNMPFIHGEKIRNQTTGKIESYHLLGECKGKTVLILDDICDGGATFELLADILNKNGAKEVHLFVSHGIFSRGVEGLRSSGIGRIFTKDGEV